MCYNEPLKGLLVKLMVDLVGSSHKQHNTVISEQLHDKYIQATVGITNDIMLGPFVKFVIFMTM